MPERREITVSSFPLRCPYCDKVVEYRDLHPGENRIRCGHCQKVYIKIVEPSEGVSSNDQGGT
ncbi:MAG: hypothetical protein JRI46_06180 [Deltaproteobacteria bacterium]|nr:hypothetical protein [Deltaproteobacteria bacterium]